MRKDIDKEYGFLWDGTQPGWVLLRAPNLRGGFSIYNKLGKTLLHIESSELNEALCKMLNEVGTEILDEVLPGEVTVRPMKESE